MKRLNKLMILAGGGLVACIAMAEIFKRQVSRRIHESSMFQEAMDMLRENKGAKYLLGQPIVDSLASFSGPGLGFTDHSAVKVYVSGPKSNGTLFITAKPKEDNTMLLDTVQLQIGRDDGKRLVIKKSDENSSVS